MWTELHFQFHFFLLPDAGAMAKGVGGPDDMCRMRLAGISDKVSWFLSWVKSAFKISVKS